MKKIAIIYLMSILFTGSAFAEFPAVEVYQNKSRCVVLIVARTEGKNPMVGAGSVISPSNLIITNAHVVLGKDTSIPSSNIKVYLKPVKVTGNFSQDLVNGYSVGVIAFNSDLDLAVLKIQNHHSFTETIELADPAEIKIGEEVVAIGHPEQGGLWTQTYGRISGEIENHEDIAGKDVYQTDTSVNRGNSGGPLLDRRGYMVGINSSIARLGAGNMPITGVNFAIKSSVVKKWLEKQGIVVAYGRETLKKEAPAIKAEATKPPPKVEEKTVQVQETKPAAQKPAEKAKETKPAPVEKTLTPKRPYDMNALIKETEKEMEDMITEMKGKIKK